MKETLGLSYADGRTETRRAEWCLERSYKESSVYLHFIFLMGMGSKAVATTMRGGTPAQPVCPHFTASLSEDGGVWVAGQGYAELHHLRIHLPGIHKGV